MSIIDEAFEIAGAKRKQQPEPDLPALEEMQRAGIELAGKLRRVCARRGLMVPEFWT